MRFFNLEIDEKLLPLHVGIIMDGNGRWARKRELPRVQGHVKGYEVLKKIVEFNRKIGIRYISVFAFSTENWHRPRDEVDFLMKLARDLIAEYTDTLLKNNIRLMVTGTKDNLDRDFIKQLDESVNKTRNCRLYVLNIVFNYGGRKEILDAAKKLAMDYHEGSLDLEMIDEDLFRGYLYQPELPDIDLIIRTSGEYRLSNFLIWQSNYAELYFTRKLWPDFSERDFTRAIFNYQSRHRRFGSV
jgi:undecaprenyl diphosphate synthase